MRRATLAALLVVLAGPAAIGADLPDADLTPGDTNPALTQKKICSKAFRTGPYRNVKQSTKKRAYARYKIKPCGGCYEIDHLISLELGGSNNVDNLWPQSYTTTPWNAHVKDALENRLHKLVCEGTVTLEDAQHEIATDWISAWYKYVQPGKT